MQLCSQCGNHNSEESIFCGTCGNRLNNKCPSCGYKNLWEQKFCGNCGKQLRQETDLPPSAVLYGSDVAARSHTAPTAPAPSAAAQQAASQSVSANPANGATAVLTRQAPPASQPGMPAELQPRQQPERPSPQATQNLSELPAYALISIEFANWEKTLAAVKSQPALDAYRKQCLALLAQHIQEAEGKIQGSKQGILFVAFKRAASLAASLEHALAFSQDLLTLDFKNQGLVLQLRIGLDIEVAHLRNPLTSTIERSMGLPSSVTVSEAVFLQMQDKFPFEKVGPLPLGNRMMTFYRLLPPGSALLGTAQSPAAPEALPVQENVPPAPMATQAFPAQAEPIAVPEQPHPAAPAEPVVVDASVASHFPPKSVIPQVPPSPEGASLPAAAPSPVLTLEAPPSMAAPEPVVSGLPPQVKQPQPMPSEPIVSAQPQDRVEQVSFSHETEVPPVTEAEQATLPPEEAHELGEASDALSAEALSFVDVPELPHYVSPVLGIYKAERQPNLSGMHAVDALVSEFTGFLAQGTAVKGKAIAICASDGLGKSSLVHMARHQVDPEGERAFWIGAQHYRCFHRDGLPLLFWIELVQNLLSLVFEGQSRREVRDRIDEFLSHIYDGQCPSEEQAFLGDLLSVQPLQPLSVEMRANLGRLEAFLLELFRTLCAKRPIVLVMEDLMYADAASLDLFRRLLEEGLADLPIYFVLTQTRDFYANEALQDALKKWPYKELVVAEMTDLEAERFLDDGPLGGGLSKFPDNLIHAVISQSKGLPLALEEALRLLHLQEAIMVDAETGKFVPNREYDPLETPIPNNLQAIIRQRLEYLDEDSLYLLNLAAVLGEKFAVNMLMALSQMEDAAVNEALTTLFNHGFIVPDAVNSGRFRHGLIWKAVYDSMEDELQVQMHQLVSETLENDFNQGLTVNPMLIAYHSENGELPNRAMNYWNLTGIYAAQVGSLVGMNMAMFRTLEVLELAVPDQPLHKQELALRLVESLGIFNLNEDPDFSAALLEWDLHYRQNEADVALLIEPLGFLASAYENQGDFSRALAALDKALALVDPNVYPLEAASLQINKMEYLVILGRLQQAREVLEARIDPVAKRPDGQQDAEFQDAYLQAQLLKSQILLAQCDGETGVVLSTALQHARKRNLEGLAIALQLIYGQLLLRQGQYEGCDKEADSLLHAIEAMPESEWFLAQWGLLAMMYHCELEDWSSASQLVLTVISKAERARDYNTWVMAQAYAGYISGKMGKIKEARQLLEQAIQLSSTYRFAGAALLGWRLLSEFELDCGNAEVAHELASRALAIADKPDIQNVYESLQLTLLSARCLMAQEQAKEAGKLLESAWPRAAKSKLQPLVATYAFSIGEFYKQLGQNLPEEQGRKHLMRSVEFFLKAKSIWLDLRHLNQVKLVEAAMPRL